MYNKTSRQNLNCVLELPTITTNWSKKKNKNYSWVLSSYRKKSRTNQSLIIQFFSFFFTFVVSFITQPTVHKNFIFRYLSFFSTGTVQNTTTIAIIIIINFVHWFLNTNIIIDYRLSTSFNNRISLSIANVFSSSYKSTSIMEWKVTFQHTKKTNFNLSISIECEHYFQIQTFHHHHHPLFW